MVQDEIPEPTPVNSHISAAVTSIIHEEKEKDKLNIIVNNLPESDESYPKLRKSYDITKSTLIIGKLFFIIRNFTSKLPAY